MKNDPNRITVTKKGNAHRVLPSCTWYMTSVHPSIVTDVKMVSAATGNESNATFPKFGFSTMTQDQPQGHWYPSKNGFVGCAHTRSMSFSARGEADASCWTQRDRMAPLNSWIPVTENRRMNAQNSSITSASRGSDCSSDVTISRTSFMWLTARSGRSSRNARSPPSPVCDSALRNNPSSTDATPNRTTNPSKTHHGSRTYENEYLYRPSPAILVTISTAKQPVKT
eukprot:gene3320-biopygen3257